METTTICPWCESDIVWDPEIGPEKYCPHCDNEISGYRTLEFDADFDNENSEQVDPMDHDLEDEDNWDDDDRGILRSKREIAANSAIQNLLNEQYEMPECVNCREYMLEAGQQVIGQQGEFEAKIAPETEMPLVRSTMKVIWYVCPSCYRTDSYLSLEDRKQMLDALSPAEEQ
ncbi:hypothetical protein ACFP56_03560 [Paenibacillus septentrionalis]|uniref:Uncharacterized protein n=1 Tax=Paenibacillus septentrionalis TaxID=429342 RepID=A0ABW1UYZ0_9BACL